MNNNLKETNVEVPIVCLDGRTSRYERRQIKVAIAKLLSKQNLIKNLKLTSLFIGGRPAGNASRTRTPWAFSLFSHVGALGPVIITCTRAHLQKYLYVLAA